MHEKHDHSIMLFFCEKKIFVNNGNANEFYTMMHA